MQLRSTDISALARVFVAGEWKEPAILFRGQQAAIGKAPWLRSLVKRILKEFPAFRPPQRRLADFLSRDQGLQRAAAAGRLLIDATPILPEFDCQLAAFQHCTLPTWRTPTQLADWLGLPSDHLAWFGDQKQLGRLHLDDRLTHYRYRWAIKRRGGVRLIESPRPQLKEIQRQILRECLSQLPVHSAAHGFQQGRSTATFVQPHSGKAIVLRMDLKHFFPSVQPFRLNRLLMLAGYPEDVARMLTAICTAVTPSAILYNSSRHGSDTAAEHPGIDNYLRVLLTQPHFPQGAPTSPCAANLIAYRLDSRLHGLAKAAGATYTRYADDLLFSGDGDFRRSVQRFHIHVSAIVLDEGFQVNHHKTRVMPKSVRQQAAGLVINQRPGIGRREFDLLKATLHNCVRLGPQSQNKNEHPDFRRHLLGRIGYVQQFHAQRGARLVQLFHQIKW